MKPVTLDFETFGIESRPNYPPLPVGLSVKWPGKKSKYYAFGHMEKNNATWGEVKEILEEAYDHKDGVLFQNAKFDLEVIRHWFGLEPPPWAKVHDTMFLLYLDDPHQKELGLKPASERLLDWPPEEQDAVFQWLLDNPPVPKMKVAKGSSAKYPYGKYIAYADAEVVGRYANGDVDRTAALFKKLYKGIVNRGMEKAYDRERRLLVVLMEMERQGLQLDLERLREDVETYKGWQEEIDSWIRKRLGTDADTNLNSGDQLFAAMLIAGVVDVSRAPLTPTGKYQTNQAALLAAVTDKQLLALLKYRAQLKTCLSTFMEPWLEVAEKNDGKIFTEWNQVKAPREKSSVGTRTGRLSSTPNFQNIPKEFSGIFRTDRKDKSKPKCPIKGLPPLPQIRSYITPFQGEVLIDRDFSQQELRILAHFDGGDLLDQYQEDPWIDFHDHTRDELAKIGKVYERKPVKTTNFGLIYGMGVGTLAERSDMSVEEAKELKKAILQLYPGLNDLYRDMKYRAKNNKPIYTWGGREYYCEPPKEINGKLVHFDYKMVNVLIQGSAADCTKEALVRLDEVRKPNWKIILNVHDQITMSVPAEEMDEAMEVLREAMESVEFDVPILSEGSYSFNNWNSLVDYDKKGERVCR